MSLICDTPEETLQIVNAINNLKNVQVVQVKNGFEPKEGEQFDPTQYADIKMILLVGSGEDYQQEELVEVQIIQRINLELKKLQEGDVIMDLEIFSTFSPPIKQQGYRFKICYEWVNFRENDVLFAQFA